MQTNAICKSRFRRGFSLPTKQFRQRTTLVLWMLLLCLQMNAQSITQTVTLKGANLSIEQVFASVKKQTGYHIAGNKDVLKMAKPITVDVKNMGLRSFLELIFRDQPLTWEISNKNIFIAKKPITTTNVTPVSTPGVLLPGRVLDEKGAAIPGVTVNVKGTTAIAITNEAGYFNIPSKSEEVTLVFSAIGFESQELRFNPGVALNTVALKVKVQQLSAVVIGNYNTGYQVLSKERATGAFGKPDMEVVKKRTATMDIITRLEGLVPGIQIQGGQTSTNRNGNGVSTQKSVIRGIGSVNLTSDPLYVVNGVIVTDFASINPDDIEDITVLKDAAAAAIWGARAANGVIVVTTKSGNKNQRLSVSYSGFINYAGKPYYGPVRMMNSAEYIQSAKEIFDPISQSYASRIWGTIAPHDQILYDEYLGKITHDQATRSLDSLASINNEGQIRDLWMRGAYTTNHTASISGGNNAYSFYGSLGYTGVTSAIPGETNNSYKLNFSQNANIGQRLRISLNTSLINTVSSRKNAITIGNDFLPYQLFRDAEGNNLSMNYLTGYTDSIRNDYASRSKINLDYVPLDEFNYGHGTSNLMHINITANASLKIWKGLSFAGSYGYQKSPGTVKSYSDNKTIDIRKSIVGLTVAPTTADIPKYYYPTTGGAYTTANNEQRSWTVRNQLIYEAKPRQGKDNLAVQFGLEANEQYNYSSSTTVLGYNEKMGTYAVLDYAALQNGIPGTVTGYGYLFSSPLSIQSTTARFKSSFALASYTFDQKYSVDASWRRDQSNQFGNDVSTQNKPIWSVGAKWQLGREEFMKSIKWLNDLGLRATYGITGNSPYLGAATTVDKLQIISASTSGATQGSMIAGDAYTLNSPANGKLTWENTTNLNIGADFLLLKGRIGGSANWYSRTTTDMIGTIPVNPFTGLSSATGNIGKMTNRGIELSLRTVNIQTEKVQWSTAFIFSYNNNKLVSFTAMNPILNTASYRLGGNILAGYTMKPLFAYQYAGLDNMGDPQIYVNDKSTITKQRSVAKINDVIYMGTTQPKYTGSISSNVAYKGLSLMTNFVFSGGNVMRMPTNTFYTGVLASRPNFQNANYPVYFLDRWKKPGDEQITNIPAFVTNESLSYTRRDVDYFIRGDVNVVKADYLKLRDVTLSYTLPATAVQFLKLQSLSIYCQASNFLIWTANGKIDPDLRIGQGKHGYALGVNVNF
ncbi:TonB-linked SusC/RagA family outer membrane protein [Chitinophaga skermanii]|uniref:TonB-linked SusC/RagA family outer membrane protein n=1 Tax=Chitinophaga skermanii TaxID=331697 RepID=A0A327QWZ1_9BACT|nr:SusC/RagA family TonB-linked outer membrane protein [Chitinophaga skermanii]RAJ08880.1 TonB-linked SusC/RagA family outer membrane protein [Chitinophaga skermanii]